MNLQARATIAIRMVVARLCGEIGPEYLQIIRDHKRKYGDRIRSTVIKCREKGKYNKSNQFFKTTRSMPPGREICVPRAVPTAEVTVPKRVRRFL